MTLLRIQRRRVAKWRMPENTTFVGRRSPWANPWRIEDICNALLADTHDWSGNTSKPFQAAARCLSLQESGSDFLANVEITARHLAVDMFKELATAFHGADHAGFATWLAPLRDKNLACYCKLCAVHAAGKPLHEFCENCERCHVDILAWLLKTVAQ